MDTSNQGLLDNEEPKLFQVTEVYYGKGVNGKDLYVSYNTPQINLTEILTIKGVDDLLLQERY